MRPAQTHWGLHGPKLHPCSWALSWAQQQQGRGRGRGRGRGEQWLRGQGEGRAWAATAGQGGSGWIGPQGSVEDFQLSQVRLGCSSLEGRVTEDRTADLSELTLPQAAIIGKQAPGKKKPKIIYQPS